MDRQVTPPKRVTSPSWCSLSPCKQARVSGLRNVGKYCRRTSPYVIKKKKQKLISTTTTTTTTKTEKEYQN